MSAPLIPIARPVLGDEEIAALERVVRSGWIMQGPEVLAFERELAAWLGAPHACAVSSGTAALHLALLAVGGGAGDEVVTVSHSFIATANAIRLCGATPVFVDIVPGTFNIDAALVEAAIGPRTRAVLCVHQMGMPCDLDALVALCAHRRVPLVEDAACAIGSEIDTRAVDADTGWQKIGRPHGAIACFSFHPRKIVTTGDGGAITTREPQLDARVRQLRQHGADASGAFVESAPNYRLTDLQAALGRVQLGRLPALLVERRAQVERYGVLLAPLGLGLPVTPPGRRSNWQSYCVRLPEGAVPATVIARLQHAGISARTGITNAHQQPAYAAAGSHRIVGRLDESERAIASTICLPLYPGMKVAEQIQVAEALRAACERRSA